MDNTPIEPRDIEPKDAHAILPEEAAALYAPLPVTPQEQTGMGSGVPVAVYPTPNAEGWHAIGTALLYLVFFRLTTFLQFHTSVVILSTLIALVLMLVFTVRVARALRTPRAIALNAALSALFTLPLALFPIFATLFPHWPGLPTAGGYYLRYRGFLHHVMGLDGLLMMWFAASVGAAISRLVREMKMLLPIAVVLACMDLYVVFGGGLVAQATRNPASAPVAVAAMNAFTVKLPTAQPVTGSAPLRLAIGLADFLFIALFFACFKRFKIAAWYTFVMLCAVLSVYMLIVAYTALALPALVPIAVVVISMNLKWFHYERSEAFALLYAGLLLGVIGAVLWLFQHK